MGVTGWPYTVVAHRDVVLGRIIYEKRKAKSQGGTTPLLNSWSSKLGSMTKGVEYKHLINAVHWHGGKRGN